MDFLLPINFYATVVSVKIKMITCVKQESLFFENIAVIDMRSVRHRPMGRRQVESHR
jgi:hypothetical protein